MILFFVVPAQEIKRIWVIGKKEDDDVEGRNKEQNTDVRAWVERKGRKRRRHTDTQVRDAELPLIVAGTITLKGGRYHTATGTTRTGQVEGAGLTGVDDPPCNP